MQPEDKTTACINLIDPVIESSEIHDMRYTKEDSLRRDKI